MTFAQARIIAVFTGSCGDHLWRSSMAQLSSLLINFYGEKTLHLLRVAVFRKATPTLLKDLLYPSV
jgi:hypothetical protein